MTFALGLKTRLLSAAPTRVRAYWDRLESSPLGYRLARGAFWSLAGVVISRASGLVASIFVARMLGKVGFGELGIIQSTVGMLATFAGFGLWLTATKHVAEFRSSDPARAGRIIGLSSLVSWVTGSVMALVLLATARWLASHSLAAAHLAPMLRLSSLLLLIGAVAGAQTGALAGFEAFKSIARVNLIAGIATLPLMVAGTWFWGLVGALWGLIISQGLGCILNYWALRAEADRARVPASWSGSGRELKILWKFSLPALASGLMVGPVYWFCSTMLVNRPGGYGQMGVFNAANQWFGALIFLPGVLGQAALPVLSERMGADDSGRSRKLLAFYTKLNAVVVAPLVILGAAASPLIMASYGPGFREAWPTLVVVLLTAGLVAVQTPAGQVLAASGRMWLGSAMNFGWAILFIVATYLLVPRGSFGLAAARLLAYVLHSLWVFAFVVFTLKKCSYSERND